MEYRKNTTYGKIITFLNKHRKRDFLVSDFCKEGSKCFVGYEAGTRLCDLQREGIVISTSEDGRFKKYRLADSLKICEVEKGKTTYIVTEGPNADLSWFKKAYTSLFR